MSESYKELTERYRKETQEKVNEMFKNLSYGMFGIPVPSTKGYPGDNQPNELVYSSILGKYINPTTGKVVEKEKV